MIKKESRNVRNLYTKDIDILKRNKEKGITLVALLITIIIMIILAAITIKIIFDIDFINLATKSVENYAGAGAKELNEMNNTVDRLENSIAKIQTASPSGGGNKEEGKVPTGVESNGSWNGKVNTPKLAGTGMQAVYWKDDGTEMLLSNTSSEAEWNNWYDYADTSVKGANSSKWANAVTKNKDGEITGYFVWIPRYEYKIDNENQSIDVRFISTNTKKGTEGYSTDETGIVKSSDGYIIHPAFMDDTEKEFNNGGWREELEGFWVAKYPAGWQQGQEGRTEVVNESKIQNSGLKYTTSDYSTNYLNERLSVGSDVTYPVFMPKTYAYNCISVGDIYLLSGKVHSAGDMYGLKEGVDSHLEKNSEWGAVAYLTHSKYGVNGNSSNMNEVAMNTTNRNNGIRVKNDPNKSLAYVYAVTGNIKDTTYSSTKNESGVFDLNGCIWEFTAGYYKGGGASTPEWHNAMATSTTKSSSEYVTLYEEKEEKIGDATTETLNWNNDILDMHKETVPTFRRRWLLQS